MARTLTPKLLSALYSAQTDEAILVLLTITAPGGTPLRVSSDSTDTVHDGDTYIAFPFMVELPGETEQGAQVSRLVIDNVDRQIVQELRLAGVGAFDVVFFLVTSSDVEVIEGGPWTFEMRDVEYDASTVQGNLVFEPLLSEAYPGEAVSPTRFPGLF